MKTIHLIEIDARPDEVWAATTALARWPEWNPNVSEVVPLETGPLEIGSKALVRQSGLPEVVWTVTAFDPGRHFAWSSRVRNVPMLATHIIEQTGESSRSRLEVEVRGLLAFLLWPLLRPQIRRAIARENTGLKMFCERSMNAETAGSRH